MRCCSLLHTLQNHEFSKLCALCYSDDGFCEYVALRGRAKVGCDTNSLDRKPPAACPGYAWMSFLLLVCNAHRELGMDRKRGFSAAAERLTPDLRRITGGG